MKIEIMHYYKGGSGYISSSDFNNFPPIEVLRSYMQQGCLVEIKDGSLEIHTAAALIPPILQRFTPLDQEAREALIFLKLSL